MQYLDTASRVAPEDVRIPELRNRLAKSYSLWLNSLGEASLEHARKIYNIWISGYESGVMDMLVNNARAKAESVEEYKEAMGLFIAASNYDIENTIALMNIRFCAKETSWFSWHSTVWEKIEILNRLEAKEVAKKNLAAIENQLTQKRSKLNSLKGKNGFWDKLTRADIQDEVTALEKQRKQYQATASYELPRNHA